MGLGYQRTSEESSHRRNTINWPNPSCFPIIEYFGTKFGSWFSARAFQTLPRTLDTSMKPVVYQRSESPPLEVTYLCKGLGVGSSPGKLRTGQEAAEPEPGLAGENGCLSESRRPHGEPQPETIKGTRVLSGVWRDKGYFPGCSKGGL